MATMSQIYCSGTSVSMSYGYSTDDKYLWIISPCIFGTQAFREVPPSMYDKINCHGYALMRDDNPQGWRVLTEEYLSNMTHVTVGDYSDAVKNEISIRTKQDFENWLNDNEYTWEYEADFSNNGEYRTLQDNQYRIVLRTGIHNIILNGVLYRACDYHFWYQMYNGRWANKHGTIGGSELLEYGVTPFSTDTDGWDVYGIDNFYDGIILSLIHI